MPMNRLKELRAAKGLSLAALSDATGGVVTRQAIWKYETGRDSPSAPVAIKLAQVLGVKGAELFSAPSIQVECLGFRASKRLGVKKRAALELTLKHSLERRVWLQQKIQPTADSTPPVQNFPVTTILDAQGAAASLRSFWGLGQSPIANLIALLESKNVYVIELEASEDFDGLCAVAKNTHGQYIAAAVAYRKGMPWSRQRFSLAHELAHLVMRVPDNCTEDEEEKLAHSFAGAFLVASEELKRFIGARRRVLTVQELFVLKRNFGASIQALTMRLYGLGLLGTRDYRNTWSMIYAAGWRKKEPGEMPAETSLWTSQAAFAAVAEGIISEEEATEFIGHVKPKTISSLSDERRALLSQPAERRRKRLEELSQEAVPYADATDWDETITDGLT